jgi:hypothetical protein
MIYRVLHKFVRRQRIHSLYGSVPWGPRLWWLRNSRFRYDGRLEHKTLVNLRHCGRGSTTSATAWGTRNKYLVGVQCPVKTSRCSRSEIALMMWEKCVQCTSMKHNTYHFLSKCYVTNVSQFHGHVPRQEHRSARDMFHIACPSTRSARRFYLPFPFGNF